MKDEKNEERKAAVENYITNFVYSEQYIFDNNEVYMNWPAAESYFIKLLDTIVNKKERSRHLDIFLKRSITSNAYTSRYGNIFFNIGMLCEAENEAFLTAILSHEVAHYIFQHKSKELGMSEEVFKYKHIDYSRLGTFLHLNQEFETQADSFSSAKMKKLNLSFESTKQWHESADTREDFLKNARSYRNMLKASSLSQEEIKQKKRTKYNAYTSHPSYIQRYDYLNKQMQSCPSCTRKFFVDSAFFQKLKKTAFEERKKIAFERNNFNSCLYFSFMDYLYGSKGPRNLYFIVESIRRLMYANQNLIDEGFLTSDIYDEELGRYKSLLNKPDYLFTNVKEYNDLKDHKFFTSEPKPFNSYQEAFFYFAQEALKSGLNEANLSLGLHYYALKNRDSSQKYLQKYVDNGNGSSIEFAQLLLEKKAPFIKRGKMLVIYNTAAYTGREFNYYQCKKKKEENAEIKKGLGADTSKIDMVITNELTGTSPQKLNTIQKLYSSIMYLYNDDDVEMCRKVRITSHYANESNEIADKFKKHFWIFAPEWYLWCKENRYEKIFLADVIYQYRGHINAEEIYNNYIGYYLDINATRPYFKDAVRNGFVRKQKLSDMISDMNEFLYK